MKKNRIRLKNTQKLFLVILTIILAAVTVLVTFTVKNYEDKRLMSEGMTRLSSIAGQVDNNLYRSESLLDSVAMQIEQIIAIGGDIDGRLESYFSDSTISDIKSRSDGSCFNAFAAYNNKLYINGFLPDDNFVLDERSWFVGAKIRRGTVNITEPYIDADSGEMCYTLSKLLTDGKTVVGLDFNLTAIQKYIEEMNNDESGTSLIVNDKGTIVGHSEPEYVGLDYKGISFYNELINKVYMLYGDTFDYTADGESYNVFSDKINYDWYLVVCVRKSDKNALFSSNSLFVPIVLGIISLAVILLFVILSRKNAGAQMALEENRELIKNAEDEIKRSVSRIISNAENISFSDEESARTGAEIANRARELNVIIGKLENTGESVNAVKTVSEKRKRHIGKGYHVVKMVTMSVVLLAAGIFAYIFNIMTQTDLINIKMEQETDVFLGKVNDWVITNKTVLNVISDSISSQPDFVGDYDSAVSYLDSIVSKHEDISVAYLCNPEWEHTVIMNNGWKPDDNWHVEERQWYIDTMVSADEFNISAPYFDEQTGLYCTTLSKIVYDNKGDFIGVLGIDYYLDKLIAILDESYTDKGYAFLTDIDGNILNHPSEEYQMKTGSSVNVANSCYREALLERDVDSVLITDYDGSLKGCLAMKEDISGFNVFLVKDAVEIFTNSSISSIIYIAVFLTCIILVNIIMISITRWQTKVNKELKEAADKAISAGKAKSDFLANMSHEIRTPINAILGMNEMIIRETKEKEIAEYAANIQSAGRTLLSVINEILDFSKIESGKMEIVLVEYDVSSLVNDIVNMVKSRAEKKKLTFIPEIDENIPSILCGDDVRLRQIITNILTNAVKYTHTGSVKLVMKVNSIENDILRLEVSVSDTGIGIREEDMELLFNSFQRLDQEKNRSIEGTGLGITIVQKLLAMMNSKLNVSSVYGKGSTFSFIVEQKIINREPMGNYEQRFKAIANNQTETERKTAPDARILVVDDNETNLLVAKNLLKRTLARIDTAASGKECIRLIKANAYDIVFLDHMMPEMDGIQTLKLIKEDNIGGEAVFIALTANAVHGARQAYLDAGFDDYLSKPFSGHDIEKCLFSHIKNELIKTEAAEVQPENKAVAEEPKSDENAMFSVETGMFYTGGDKASYDEILRVYVNKAPSKLELIQKLFDEKDWKNYVIEVHALKSSSLTIGAKPLSELAKELELSGKAENYTPIEEKNGTLLEMYEEVCGLAKSYLGITEEDNTDEAAELREITAEELNGIIEELKSACDSFDGDKIDEICKESCNCSYNSKPLKSYLDEIKAFADDFEYESALHKIEELAHS